MDGVGCGQDHPLAAALRGMSPHAAIGGFIDALMDMAQAARASGADIGATQMHAAIGCLAVARRQMRPAAIPIEGDLRTEQIATWDGGPCGLSLSPDPIARRGRLAEGCRTGAFASIAAHDLGWELQSSEAARRLAAHDVTAALMARTLSQTCWVDPDRRCRWSTSVMGAVTAIRLLRAGAPFQILDPGGTLLHGESLDVAGSLGWRPALTR